MRQAPFIPRSSYFAAWPLAVLLVTMAGCGLSSENPIAPLMDTVAPTVTSILPVHSAAGVAAITATFSEAMNASTITTATFTVSGPGATPVTGTVAYSSATYTATFTPTSPLVSGTAFTATITTEVQDVAGNKLTKQGILVMPIPIILAPVLGGAGAFAVLAGSTITNTGPSGLTGDMGVSPGTAVTGFPPGTLTGSMHAGDPTSAAANADLTTAYNDAAGRTLGPVAVAGNLGGMTLAPGLYKSTSSLEISSGDLTLDAQGDPNAVYIFQMASTLTTTSGRAVILSGGARASNIFWQVGSSATLGTTSAFKGTIMADQSITLNTGATLSGRALARIGAVTLDGNAVVVPTP